MKILALEFSTDRRSAAVLDSGATSPGGAGFQPATGSRAGFQPAISSAGFQPAVMGHATQCGSRSTAAFSLIEQALLAAQLEREQIECVAVGLGPGSYTGIRVAISVAQGWQLALGVRLLGLSTVECLVAQAHADGCRGRVNIALDAQRNELYLAGYDLTADGWREVEPLHLATLAAAHPLAAHGGLFIGPEVRRWFPDGRELFPDAAALVRLAASRTNFIPGEKLEPVYLRETSFVKAPPPRVIP